MGILDWVIPDFRANNQAFEEVLQKKNERQTHRKKRFHENYPAGCGGALFARFRARDKETKVVDSKGKERKFHYLHLGQHRVEAPG